MRISDTKISGLIISLSLLMSACGTKTETKVVTVPEVKIVEVPVTVPGEKEVIKIPEIIAVDKSVGIKSLPKPISLAPTELQALSKAVAKVFAASGASGTGFFISKDGLFLTNEHVVPVVACVERKCPGYKIVTGFHKNGTVKSYTDFEVLAHDSEQYDFALIKVKLKPGEQVDYLELELSPPAIDQNSDGSTHTVIGHPGGASLHFAEAKPIGLEDVSIRFQGVVIPGNSGGPLVDLKTKKVIGLVKSMRTMPSKDGTGSAFFENMNQATAMWELNNYIQKTVGTALLAVNESTDMKELNRVSSKLPEPEVEDFGSVLRRPSDDVRLMPALSLFIRLIGSDYEQKALALMFAKEGKHKGSLNMQMFRNLMSLSLAIGRPLKFDAFLKGEIEQELTSSANTSEANTALILLNYFEEPKRSELQKACLKNVLDIPQMLIMAPYTCYSTQLSDGRSIFPIYSDWLVNQSGFSTLDQMGSVTAILMMSGAIGLKDANDIKAVEDINNYVDQKGRDLETLMRNDSYAIGLLKNQIGVGTFKTAFPN
ncbi:MAG: serine protease [Bdellovibrionota bacterium]